MEKHRLSQLASFAPRLRDCPDQFVQFIPLMGKGTSEEPYVLGTGHSILSNAGDGFVKMAYDAGWVVKDFDWPEWQTSDEFKLLLIDREILARANRSITE